MIKIQKMPAWKKILVIAILAPVFWEEMLVFYVSYKVIKQSQQKKEVLIQ